MRRFKIVCSVCGKVTAGRLPRASRHDMGDGTFWFPRRHDVDGKPCDGNIEEGKMIDAPSIDHHAAHSPDVTGL